MSSSCTNALGSESLVATVAPYKTKQGRRWQVQYNKPDGARTRKRGFHTKAEAQAWFEDQNVSRRKGTWVDPSRGKETVETIGTQWLAAQTHLKPSTARPIKNTWNNHVLTYWGHRSVSSIRKSEVQEWISTTGLTPATARRAHSILAQVLDAAIDDGCLAVNPARGVRLPRKPKPVKVYLTLEQVRTLAEESRQPEIIWLLATCGLRWSELAGLQVGDFDLERRRAHLQRAAVTVVSKVEVGTLKTHENRKIAVPAFVCNMLAPRLKGRSADEWVWQRADGGPLKLPSTGSFFHCALNRVQAGDSSFPDVTIHGLRHVAAGLLVSAGANVKVVQRQLGHSSAAMTLDQYADLFDGDLDEVADALEVEFAQLDRPKVISSLPSEPKMSQKSSSPGKCAG